MIIKTFRAETSSAALKRVREEMGGDAIVLKTTQQEGSLGRVVYEVTACLENPTVGQTSKIFPDETTTAPRAIVIEAPELEDQSIVPTPEPTLKPTPEINHQSTDDVWQKRYEKLELKINTFLETGSKEQQSMYAPFENVYEQLLSHDFSAEFINEFITELQETYDSADSTMAFVKMKLAEKIIGYTTEDFSLSHGDKLAVVGPAGAGKSSVMGKLAATLVMREKKKVTLITLDDVKMGAYDETAAYAEILGVDYADNRNAEESAKNNNTITLIDTVALPNIVENIIPINDKLDAIKTNYRIAVFSAIMRSKDVVLFQEQMKTINATHLVITKTDMTSCLGTLITAAHTFGLKIIYTTDTLGGIGLLHRPQAAELVNQILQSEVASE